VRSSASKVRPVLDLIRGESCGRADEILQFSERRIAGVVARCLDSAIANAEHNSNLPVEELYVAACYADEGPTLKRWRPRARGRATPIMKRTCHITIVLARYSLEEREARAERGLAACGAQIPPALLARIANHAGGDARVALLALEALARAASGTTATEELLRDVLQRRLPQYDKQGEAHFNLISALHKSVRSSDPDAALYWLACMLEGGEDRLYIGRRLVRMAAEDIGLADPRAVEMAMAAVDAFRLVGEPEGDLFLAHVAVYLAVAPKSDAVYRALGEARSDVRTGPPRQVPLHLRNAPTKLMRDQGYAEGYEHAHASDDALVGMSCLPEGMEGKRYYSPTRRGIEDRIAKRLEEILAARAKLRAQRSD